jgi:oxaloacetate decarboxylase gamma subunit
MFGQSAVLALLGMGVVFCFLAILIVCVTVTGKLIHALGLDKENPPKTATAAASGRQEPVVAAISAAVKAYRGE